MRCIKRLNVDALAAVKRCMLIGSMVLLAQAGLVWGAVRVVPGTPSFVDLHIEGLVRVNGPTADETWNEDRHLLVGVDWPGETHPPLPGDWTLDETHRVDDGPDYSQARTKAEFDFDYSGPRTDVLLRSRSEGITESAEPGDDEFQAWSWMTGVLEMWLTGDAVDPEGPYDIELVVTLTGSDLSVLGSGSAAMDHFVRVTPVVGAGRFEFSGAYTDLLPPALNPDPPPKYLVQGVFSFSDVMLDTTFAHVDLGVDLAKALRTNAEGLTVSPTITKSEAYSLFDSTLSLQFEACPSADLNGDCCVNFLDFAIFVETWLKGCN